VTLPTVCILLTSDPELTRRLDAAAADLVDLRTVGSRAELERWQERTGPTPLLLDLRHADSAGIIAEASPEMRATLIAFGLPESSPFIACREAGIFAVEPLSCAPSLWRQTVRQLAAVVQLQEERDGLRQRLASAERTGVATRAAEPAALAEGAPLHPFVRASRHFHDAQRLLEHAVEGLAAATGIVRVGVFARWREEPAYRLRAGMGCLEGTDQYTFAPHEPLVRWLDRQAHLVCRTHLPHVTHPQERLLLLRALDAVGAEIILPLPGKHGLLGWIFVGHRATGLPFAPRDLADLAVMGTQVATLLENALLYAEIAVQKTLAENLLDTVPVGIVAAAEDGTVRWFNRAAETILGLTAAATVNHPIEQAGSRLADLVRRALQGSLPDKPVAWTDPATRRTLEATVHRVGRDTACLGAMLLLTDATRERLLREKQEELERHAFWNDLAAAMSHEVRNPLVAISTFAQLLPERYQDEEFRQQFYGIVTGEVRRLNLIITQINDFAHPPVPAFHAVTPAHLAEQARERARHLLPPNAPPIEVRIEPDLPRLTADETSLADGLAHLLANACEAVQSRPDGKVVLHVRRAGAVDSGSLAFAVSDNGPGIPADMQDKLFSPFGTTKPRGLGLGLPLARRAAVDHGGRIDVDSTPQGTTVTLLVPVERREADHAETVDR
jgi:nitrogen-specific signal transduction histidine kinase